MDDRFSSDWALLQLTAWGYITIAIGRCLYTDKYYSYRMKCV